MIRTDRDPTEIRTAITAVLATLNYTTNPAQRASLTDLVDRLGAELHAVTAS